MIQKIITEIQQEVDKLDVTDPTQNGIAEGLLTAKRIAEKAVQPQRPKLSDLLKTNCYIDCGTRDRTIELAELLPSFGVSPAFFQSMGVLPHETVLCVGEDSTFHSLENLGVFASAFPHPIYKLENIEL